MWQEAHEETELRVANSEEDARPDIQAGKSISRRTMSASYVKHVRHQKTAFGPTS